VKRRAFIAGLGSAAAWPLVARAQQAPKMARLGYLAPAPLPHLIEALRGGLRDLGYVEGQNLAIEYRFALNQSKTYDDLAAELVRLGPDAIVTVATPPAIAAKRATTTIPIIMATVGDPLRFGLVTNLAHPGGNITGVTLYGGELANKRLEVLTEAVPGTRRVAVLGNADNPFSRFSWDDIQPSGQALGMELRLYNVKGLNDLPTAFAAMTRDGFGALIVLSDATFNSARRQIIGLAATHGLPTIYEAREFVEDGGLISYGPNIADLTRRSAVLIDKVLKGATPADLPIEQPTKFELVINLRTAKALGLEIPPQLLARVDEVIE
jgi:putative tryptophan/tyrosine transport system substrate-binding protein